MFGAEPEIVRESDGGGAEVDEVDSSGVFDGPALSVASPPSSGVLVQAHNVVTSTAPMTVTVVLKLILSPDVGRRAR